jgi:hypothetical protein
MAKTLRVHVSCGLVAVSFGYDDEEFIVALDGDNLFVWQLRVILTQWCADINKRPAGRVNKL